MNTKTWTDQFDKIESLRDTKNKSPKKGHKTTILPILQDTTPENIHTEFNSTIKSKNLPCPNTFDPPKTSLHTTEKTTKLPLTTETNEQTKSIIDNTNLVNILKHSTKNYNKNTNKIKKTTIKTSLKPKQNKQYENVNNKNTSLIRWP